MSRLTEFIKDLNRYEYKRDEKGYCYLSEGQLVQKLGRLEDLEEQLGCPLEVREKALIKDFIWYDDNGRLIQVIPMNSGYIMEKGKKIAVLNCIYNFNFWLAIKCKDYKKTWWLKEDKE